MTIKRHAVNQLSCYGFNRFEDIPEEFLDYLPENIESDEEEELSWNFDTDETPVEKLLI